MQTGSQRAGEAGTGRHRRGDGETETGRRGDRESIFVVIFAHSLNVVKEKVFKNHNTNPCTLISTAQITTTVSQGSRKWRIRHKLSRQIKSKFWKTL